MRVLFFSRDYTPHDYRFLTSLAESGHRVFFLRLEHRGIQMENRSLPSQIDQLVWRGGNLPARWRDYPILSYDFKGIINKIKPDIVHAGPIQSAAFLSALAGFKPLVSMSWGSDLLKDADRNHWMKWVTRFTLNKTVVLLGDCQAVKEKAQRFGFLPERVVLFPWGIDLKCFFPHTGEDMGNEKDLRKELHWQSNFVLLSLRSWEPIYGVDLVVQAFINAVKKNSALRLLLLGDGSQSSTIRRVLLENGVMDKVFFAGQISNQDLPFYYHAANLYISASHSDGSSVSLMESLASGLPVLVSDIPGNLEWITPGKEGWFFPDGNVMVMAEKILTAVKEFDKLVEMGSAARALAERRADWQENFKKLLQAYEMAVIN